MDLREIGWDGIDWIDLAQDRDEWRALVNTDAIIKIARNEGPLSLWSGLSPTIVLAVPATVVYFVTYENLRLLIKDRHGGVQPHWGPLMAGATARFWAVTLVSPLELIRTKMQSKKVSYQEMRQALKSLLQYHGIRGLFKGLGSTLLRDVPFSGIYWFHYEKIKGILSPGVPSFGVSFVAGAAAGSIASVATNPFDVVKTHQQIELGEKEIYSGTTVNQTFYVEVLKRLIDAVRCKRGELWRDQSLILYHDNAPAHALLQVLQFLVGKGIPAMDHLAYSPDLSPVNFWLFPKLKRMY
ncbi:Solute carrier family 25 member 40 [Cryptotermes secundus]|uniref:Solute carrier family 25 member 40 n=1 Tax=Cryptotermes secundus TaxID=105785 RepID=A0A2J7QYQ6_9NEOP|nr:Solute carrier family 25 member 40 [Cryptotermes secundus]